MATLKKKLVVSLAWRSVNSITSLVRNSPCAGLVPLVFSVQSTPLLLNVGSLKGRIINAPVALAVPAELVAQYTYVPALADSALRIINSVVVAPAMPLPFVRRVPLKYHAFVIGEELVTLTGKVTVFPAKA